MFVQSLTSHRLQLRIYLQTWKRYWSSKLQDREHKAFYSKMSKLLPQCISVLGFLPSRWRLQSQPPETKFKSKQNQNALVTTSPGLPICSAQWAWRWGWGTVERWRLDCKGLHGPCSPHAQSACVPPDFVIRWWGQGGKPGQIRTDGKNSSSAFHLIWLPENER